MKALIAGGGTGGHIYPAVTIGKALQEKGAEVLFVGTARGLEAEIVPREGFPIEFIEVDYFPRRLSLRLARSLFTALKGVGSAFRIVRSFRPDVCIGTGGYVAGPVVLAAALGRVPTVIHEQNALPGVTNRILGRFVDRIALGYEAASQGFSRRDKLAVTGNPVRPEILALDRTEGARRLGLSPNQRTVLIFGASQGARSINRAVLEAIPAFAGIDAQIVHVTGKAGFLPFVEECRQRGMELQAEAGGGRRLKNLRVVPYMFDMPAALAASDLVVGRAGAISIAEVTARGLPAVIVPYPHAAEGHQEKNAAVLAAAGAAEVIPDQELDGERLIAAVTGLLGDRRRMQAMAQASRRLGRPEAVWEIVALVEGLVADHTRSSR